MKSQTSAKRPPSAALYALFYVASACLIISSNTLLGVLPVDQTGAVFTRHSAVLLVGALVAILVLTWKNARPPLPALRFFSLWGAIVLVTYVASIAVHGEWGGYDATMFLLLFVLFPPLLYVLGLTGHRDAFLKSFINLVVALAVASVILWVIGPLAGLIAPNTGIKTIWYDWNTMPTMDGYFHLLYETQVLDLGSFVVQRNTGIFPEGPMYSYVLSVALLLECFVLRRPRQPVIWILVVTVLTTFTSTGYIVLIGILIGSVLLRLFRNPAHRVKRAIAVASVAAVGSALAAALLIQKLNTSSGSTRVDDFAAGFKAWSLSPVFGNGYQRGDAIVAFMSDFRSNNLGFSNSLMDVLARAGLVLFLLLAFALIGYFRSKNPKSWMVGAVYAFLWTVTIVTYLPLTAMVFSLGVTHWVRTTPKPLLPDSDGGREELSGIDTPHTPA